MVAINPAAALLGDTNAIVGGSSRRYDVHGFVGPLSVKSVIRGSAVWEAGGGRFEVTPRTALLLNDGEEYALTIDAPHPVETFCLFFARGFVEDAVRSRTTGSADLLDVPAPAVSVAFFERLHFDDALVGVVHAAHARFRDELPLDGALYDAAIALAELECDAVRRAAKLPAVRATTRDELRRRVDRGTAYLHASLARPVTVVDAAREACLSPFHFHRLFAAFHGETPHRYLSRLRLERARALLRNDDRPVADVAAACGFASVTSFTTLFARCFGVPPARFRRIGEDAAAHER